MYGIITGHCACFEYQGLKVTKGCMMHEAGNPCCEQCRIYALKISNLLQDLKRLEMDAYLMSVKLKNIMEITKEGAPYLAIREEIQAEQKKWTGEIK